MAIEFNDQQNEAIALAVEWYKGLRNGKHDSQIFFISGCAGTGKTSVASTIAEICVSGKLEKVAYVAPTGKAASRLRQKGCANARTIHSFAYNILGEDDEGAPIFRPKGALDERPLLIVCDEVSMLGKNEGHTLLSHNIPILAIGDTGQLPPVKAVPFLTQEDVDYSLTKIERQCENSNIIRASQIARQGKMLPPREYEDVRIRLSNPPLDELMDHAGEDSQIICPWNSTRNAINNKIRQAMGYAYYTVPEVGEKVICTFNQHDYGFMNGEQMIVESFRKPTDDEIDANWPVEMLMLYGKSLSTGKTKKVAFNPLSFSADFEIRDEAIKSIGGFDYGYCITIHKSQGSEFSKVLVIEERMNADYAKMMYTAFTRAIDRLTVYRK